MNTFTPCKYIENTEYVYSIQYKHNFIGSKSHSSKVNIRTIIIIIAVPLKTQCRRSLSGMKMFTLNTHTPANIAQVWNRILSRTENAMQIKSFAFSCMGLKVFVAEWLSFRFCRQYTMSAWIWITNSFWSAPNQSLANCFPIVVPIYHSKLWASRNGEMKCTQKDSHTSLANVNVRFRYCIYTKIVCLCVSTVAEHKRKRRKRNGNFESQKNWIKLLIKSCLIIMYSSKIYTLHMCACVHVYLHSNLFACKKNCNGWNEKAKPNPK